MWPQVMPDSGAWLSQDAYTDLRARFANRPGARRLGAAFAPGAPVQLASAGPGGLDRPGHAAAQAGDTGPGPSIALSGVIHRHGTAGSIAHVAATARSRMTPPGPYTAALLDADGATLHARSFDTERPPPAFPRLSPPGPRGRDPGGGVVPLPPLPRIRPPQVPSAATVPPRPTRPSGPISPSPCPITPMRCPW